MRPAPAPLRLALLAAVFALTCGGVARAGTADGKTVAYGGVSVRVPASWPVYDLRSAPHTCIRYDRPAVYLGHPDAEQDCPAHAIGRTEALLIEPEAPDASTGARGRSPAGGVEDAMTRRLHGVRLSVSFGDGESRAAAILGSARVTPAAKNEDARTGPDTDGDSRTGSDSATSTGPDADAPIAAPHPDTRARTPETTGGLATVRTRKLEPVATFTGTGFDTCAAPAITTMAAWAAHSPFKAAGVYIGGADRACPDGNLTPSWVRQADDQGWNLFPIYVGRQAPCWKDPGGVDAALIQHGRRWTQGVEAADDAANRAAYFGLAPASTVYFDMEYYPRHVVGCTEDVQAFLSAWTEELHKRGYLSGVYSSTSGAITDMAAVYDTGPAYRPDAAWFAHWDMKPALFGDPTIGDRFWPGHRRIKQFAGGHNETFGGKKVNIDSDALDAPVAALK